MKLLQQHKALGISDQIDFDKFDLDSIPLPPSDTCANSRSLAIWSHMVGIRIERIQRNETNTWWTVLL